MKDAIDNIQKDIHSLRQSNDSQSGGFPDAVSLPDGVVMPCKTRDHLNILEKAIEDNSIFAKFLVSRNVCFSSWNNIPN